MIRKSLPKVIGVLPVLLMLMFCSVMNVSADNTGVTIATDTKEHTVTVGIAKNSIEDGQISVVCFSPQWEQENFDLKKNQEQIVYLDQFELTDGLLDFEFKLKEKPANGTYFLVISTSVGRSVQEFHFKPTATVTYTAEAGGSIQGEAIQEVYVGEATSEVTAVPNTGYEFEQWSDGKTTAKRNETNVQADKTITARFKKIEVTVTYKAEAGGSIQGEAIQKIAQGGNTSAVTAVPNTGYVFEQWSDGKTVAKRNETNVQADKTITAKFKKEDNGATGTNFIIKFDPNKGTVSKKTVTVKEGNTIGTLPVPTRKGYLFMGWYTSKAGGMKISTTTKVTKSLTIYAQWEAIPAKGTTFQSDSLKYKVVKTASATASGTVQLVAPVNKNQKRVTIPKTVKLRSLSYRVESIKSNAFKNNRKLQVLTVGDNVTEIQSNAFSGCTSLKTVSLGTNIRKIGGKVFYNDKNLKNINIKSKKLTSVGKNTFKNIHNKAVIKVPSAKLKAYKKLMKGKGQHKTVVIKK